MEATHMGKRTGAREFPTDAEVEELARRVIENFPPGAAQVLAGYGIDPRDGIRFHPVATRCREARERRGLTIKSAAHELRIPQYRLRDVENGQTNRIEPEVLARYLALLDLGRWFARWKAYNPELTAKLGATTIPGHGRTRASRRAGRREGAGVLQFKVRLQDIEPAVWRRIQVPADYTFWDLHVAIQDAMGWKDYHLHEFRLDETSPHEPLRIGIPDDEFPQERPRLPGWEVRIAPYFTAEGARAAYLYDFGDGWEHVLEFEGAHPHEARGRYPRCVAGARACPPEDVGGTPGYEDFLTAVADAEHEQHEDMLRWVGGSFDPEAFSAERVCFDDPRMRWRLAFARG